MFIWKNCPELVLHSNPKLSFTYSTKRNKVVENDDPSKVKLASNTFKEGEGKSLNEPKNWKNVWSKIKELRSMNPAPVDKVGPYRWGHESKTEQSRFQTLFGLMLSSQTRDPIVFDIVKKAENITVDKLLAMENDELERLISGASFANRKVLFLKQTAKIIKEKSWSKDDGTVLANYLEQDSWNLC